ncbi:hypothetical protein LXL04_011668 [Taraxacum kok-saghyz]
MAGGKGQMEVLHFCVTVNAFIVFISRSSSSSGSSICEQRAEGGRTSRRQNNFEEQGRMGVSGDMLQVDSRLHDYHQIIKRLMDLGTVKSNRSKCLYYSPLDFNSGVRLVFGNAMLYNQMRFTAWRNWEPNTS